MEFGEKVYYRLTTQNKSKDARLEVNCYRRNQDWDSWSWDHFSSRSTSAIEMEMVLRRCGTFLGSGNQTDPKNVVSSR